MKYRVKGCPIQLGARGKKYAIGSIVEFDGPAPDGILKFLDPVTGATAGSADERDETIAALREVNRVLDNENKRLVAEIAELKGASEKPGLGSMTKAELSAYAKDSLGIDVDTKLTKSELVDEINKQINSPKE